MVASHVTPSMAAFETHIVWVPSLRGWYTSWHQAADDDIMMLLCCCAVWRLQASLIAEEIAKHGADAVRIVFNKFHSAISFKPTLATVLNAQVRFMIGV